MRFEITNVASINAQEGKDSLFWKVLIFKIEDGEETLQWPSSPEFSTREEAESWMKNNGHV